MDDKRLNILKSMNEHYDQLYKRVHYLFVGHGAGLVGCLTILKDYGSTPQYRGVGLPIVLFGIGLIAAIVNYITLAFSQMVAKDTVLGGPVREPSMTVFWIHYGAMAISIIAFIVALVIIVGHAASL
ncbi:hypothetical protein ACVIHH_000027 [Bradyrhizobium sp. USDA 4518]